jgi:hypothetical protein
LGVLLVVAILVSIIQSALSLLFVGLAAVVPGLSDEARSTIVAVVSTVIGALINPVQMIAITLLYFDLRVRKEGLDLEQLARATSPGPSPV